MKRPVLGILLLGTLLAPPAQGAFTELQRLQSSSAQPGEEFGSNVALAGDIGVVCTPRYNRGNGLYGRCVLYRLIDGAWETDGVLFPTAGIPGAFGHAVAISGDRIVVGSPGWDGTPDRAYVFRRAAVDSWVEEATLVAFHNDDDNAFGASVAIDGDGIAVGAPGEIDATGQFSSPGGAYVFRRNGTAWGLEQKFSPTGSANAVSMGSAVALDGDNLVVGFPTAFAFYTRGGNHWQQRHFEPAPSGQYFSGSIALQGTELFVGGSNMPGAYLYERSGDAWGLVRLLVPPGPSGNLGHSVAVAGTTLVVGRPTTLGPAAYVYRAVAGDWVEGERLEGSSTTPDDRFGAAVATDGTHLLIGAPVADNDAGIRTGEAYVFVENAGNAPPTAHAGTDATVECTGPAGGPITLDGSGSIDPDSTPGTNDDLVAFEWLEGTTSLGTGEVLDVVLPVGSHTITLRVMDGDGAADEDTLVVNVVDTAPLALTVSLSPALLWPPNHRLVDVTATLQITGACGPTSVTLESVTSDEPDDAPGGADGNTANDVQDASMGTDDRAFRLRAERAHGDSMESRTYTATYRIEELGAGSVVASGTVVVPMFQNGVVDPIFVRLTETASGTQVDWTPAEGAQAYNVIQGRLQDLASTADAYALGTVQCIEHASLDLNTAGFEHAALPLPGEAFFYAVEYDDVTYGAESAAKPRVVVAGDCP